MDFTLQWSLKSRPKWVCSNPCSVLAQKKRNQITRKKLLHYLKELWGELASRNSSIDQITAHTFSPLQTAMKNVFSISYAATLEWDFKYLYILIYTFIRIKVQNFCILMQSLFVYCSNYWIRRHWGVGCSEATQRSNRSVEDITVYRVREMGK